MQPAVLVSLTAPKRCAKGFNGVHYLGGRFVPPQITDKFRLKVRKQERGNKTVSSHLTFCSMTGSQFRSLSDGT